MIVIDSVSHGNCSRCWINVGLLFSCNNWLSVHMEPLQVIDAVVFICGTVNAEEIIEDLWLGTWLTMMIVSLLWVPLTVVIVVVIVVVARASVTVLIWVIEMVVAIITIFCLAWIIESHH